MLIDQLLPNFDIQARYQIDIDAPVERAYAVARHHDMRDSFIIRWLCRLRGLPKSSLTFEGMFKLGFVQLADKPSQEIVFGLVGRFWTPSPQILRIQADDFLTFNQPGFAKVVGNIAFMPRSDAMGVRVSTETRVRCFGNSSRRAFRLYWLLIAPFSGIIRKEWLRLIKHRAEAR
ncbi:MAG: hypothetical protein C4567_06455 [Deltaproteobacteria bacterium]|nr:MAG: hypothetical protein C4567_06455 [Deltaproteobacteria bacterium]